MRCAFAILLKLTQKGSRESIILHSRIYTIYSHSLGMFRQFRNLNMNSTSESSTQVGGTGEDVSDVLVEHELISSLLSHQLLNLVDSGTESFKDLKTT